MTRIAEIADRLHRLAKRREDEGIYTDAALCEEAADALAAIGAGTGPLNMPTDPAWYAEKAKLEEDREIGAGRRTMTISPTSEEISEMERLQFEALPKWAQDEITTLRSAIGAGAQAVAAAGWIIGNGTGLRWRTWKDGLPDWTTDKTEATRYSRREDAEAAHREDEDAWIIVEYRPHDWFEFKGMTCCRSCGIVRNATSDNRNCKGPVSVGLRIHPQPLPLKEEGERVLEPFAAEADEWANDVPDGYHPGVTEPGHNQAHASAKFSLGHLRAARALLSRLRAGEQMLDEELHTRLEFGANNIGANLEADECRQIITLLSRLRAGEQEGWRSMDSAPGDEETPVLLWINGQCAVGLTWKRRDGTIIGKASMFGNSIAEYWQPLPASPSVSEGASRG